MSEPSPAPDSKASAISAIVQFGIVNGLLRGPIHEINAALGVFQHDRVLGPAAARISSLEPGDIFHPDIMTAINGAREQMERQQRASRSTDP